MSSTIGDDKSSMSKCAACNKVSDNLKVCTSCEQVSYCNAKCRKSHFSKHKKECRRLAAERHNEATISGIDVDAISEKLSRIEVSDEELFKMPPPKDDCPICMLPMPYANGWAFGVGTVYQSCCGKQICTGCLISFMDEIKKGNIKDCCAFCRKPNVTDEEHVRRVLKRMKLNDAEAFDRLGDAYKVQEWGLKQDINKSLELWSRAAELGSPSAHSTIADAYRTGEIVGKDMNKALQHYKLAAMGGNCTARHNLGVLEDKSGNIHIAMKHYMIAAKCGHENSLKMVKAGYKYYQVTKDEYLSTLSAYERFENNMKSEERAKAAASGRLD